MRIAIQTLGTRGDVQPYIALALELIARGHEVQIVAPEQFEAMIQGFGVPFAALPGDFLKLLDTPEGKAAIAGGQGFSAGLKLLKHIKPLIRKLLDAERSAVEAFSPDVLVCHPKSIAGPHLAEWLAAAFFLASPLPGFTPTSAFPSPMLPFRSLGPLNRLSHNLVSNGSELLFRKTVAQWREESLGLDTRGSSRRKRDGTLYAYSPSVVPVPADWPADVCVSGYWFLESRPWRASEELAAFLAAGEPPIYFGFGSIPGINPRSMADIIVEALKKTGRRGLLAIGGGALAFEGGSAAVHIITEAPHDRLFAHVGATVHHGGAGTTAAALRAGKPTTVCPFFGDQPFWGRRVADLGVGPAPLERKSLSADDLAAAIHSMDAPEMRGRAAALGAEIRAENGVASAADFIERRVALRGN